MSHKDCPIQRAAEKYGGAAEFTFVLLPPRLVDLARVSLAEWRRASAQRSVADTITRERANPELRADHEHHRCIAEYRVNEQNHMLLNPAEYHASTQRSVSS
jgi:hypothetical protein